MMKKISKTLYEIQKIIKNFLQNYEKLLGLSNFFE